MNSEELTNYHEHDYEHLCVHEHDHELLCVHEVTETSNNTFIHFEPCSDVIDFICFMILAHVYYIVYYIAF